MKALLVRVGIDSAFGNWNAPIDPQSREFVYLPIPEVMPSHKHLERRYTETLPVLKQFCEKYKLDLARDLNFPTSLLNKKMHLDPDFHELTYGDNGARRGVNMSRMKSGDVLAFYSSLRPIKACAHTLIYAIIGLYVVKEVVSVGEVQKKLWKQNAHTRRANPLAAEIVVRAEKNESGRLESCIPIGEWRDRAYRVRGDLIKKWGGISVNNGYIQRSAVPPALTHPQRFYDWFLKQNVTLIKTNN